jgi:hypothetical protein
MSITPEALQVLLDELEASRVSRKRTWDVLQEIRWVLKDTTGVELPPPSRKKIDLEGRIVKDGVRKALNATTNGSGGSCSCCAPISDAGREAAVNAARG